MDKKFLVLLGVLGVSFSSIFVRFSQAPSVVLVFYRNAFAAGFLLAPVMTVYRQEIKKIGLREMFVCCLSGGFLALHFFLFFESVKFTSIASSTALVNTEVFFVAIGSYLFFREGFSKKAALGIGVTFAGSLMIVFVDGGEGQGALYGDMLAVMGAGAMSLYTIIGRRQRKNISTAVYTFFVYLSASLFTLLYCLISGISIGGYKGLDYTMALCMTVCCTFLGHSIFSYCLKYVKPVFISTAKLGEPLFATLLALLLFHEMPGVVQIAGALMVIGGLSLYGRYEQQD